MQRNNFKEIAKSFILTGLVLSILPKCCEPRSSRRRSARRRWGSARASFWPDSPPGKPNRTESFCWRRKSRRSSWKMSLFRTCQVIISFSFVFLSCQSKLIIRFLVAVFCLDPNLSLLGHLCLSQHSLVFFYCLHHFIEMRLLLRGLIKDTLWFYYEIKVRKDRNKGERKKKSPVPCGSRTLNLTITRRVSYCCATTAARFLIVIILSCYWEISKSYGQVSVSPSASCRIFWKLFRRCFK